MTSTISMVQFTCYVCCVSIFIGLLHTADAHEVNSGRKHNHPPTGHHDNDDHSGNQSRQLGIIDELFSAQTTSDLLMVDRNPCKDGESPFTVGQATFKCLADFHQNGEMCGTPAMTEEEQAKAKEDFQSWKNMKTSIMMGLQADVPDAMSLLNIDWSNPSTIITIPTYFHVMHSGTSGKKFTYASNPAYIQNQIKALNIGYRGDVNSAFPPNPNGRSYNRYSISNANTKIQFCLAGTTATDNAAWYTVSHQSTNELAMKKALKKGGRKLLMSMLLI
jgi:hypothetical protein